MISVCLAYLNRGEMSDVEHIRSLGHPINGYPHPPTCFRIPNTRNNLPPVAITRHALLQPPRIVLKIILQVSAVHHPPTGPLVGDNVGEYDEPDQNGNDQEHDDEVEPHEEGVAVTRAGEPRQGHDHDADADDDERPLQELEAVGVVGPAAQPYSAT